LDINNDKAHEQARFAPMSFDKRWTIAVKRCTETHKITED